MNNREDQSKLTKASRLELGSGEVMEFRLISSGEFPIGAKGCEDHQNRNHSEGGKKGRGEFPYLMAQGIGMHSTELLTTPSARLGLELDHLIALTGRNQITLMRTRSRGHSASGTASAEGIKNTWGTR